MSQFDLPPGLVESLDKPAPPSGALALVLSALDRWFPNDNDGVGIKIVAVLAVVATVGLLKLTSSMLSAWGNYTRRRFTSSSLTGSALIAAPSLMAIAVTSYLVRRAFFQQPSRPRSTFLCSLATTPPAPSAPPRRRRPKTASFSIASNSRRPTRSWSSRRTRWPSCRPSSTGCPASTRRWPRAPSWPGS